MSLLLQILTHHGLPYRPVTIQEFDSQGGSIGRNNKNQLVLASPAVSGFHAFIEYREGQYYLKDGEYEQQFGRFVLKKPSTNGTLVVQTDLNSIPLNGTEVLLTGQEKIYIGEFEIGVEILLENVADATVTDQPNNHFNPLAAGPFGMPEVEQSPAISSESSLSGLSFFEQPNSFSTAEAKPSDLNINAFSKISPDFSAFTTELNATPPESFTGLSFLNQVEPVTHSNPLISAETSTGNPADILNKLVELYVSGSGPVQTTATASFAEQASFQSTLSSVNPNQPSAPVNLTIETNLLKAFLTGAGLTDQYLVATEQQTQVMQHLGELFRTLLTGLVDELNARKAMKESFRLSQTTLQALNNNPLKFHLDTDELIKSLLLPTESGYIQANLAVVEGFKDLKWHRLAIMAALQTTLSSQLAQFNPEIIENNLPSGNPLTKKNRCWDLYCEQYPQLKTRALQDIFGDEFAEEYEKQIRHLSSTS